MKKIPKLYTKNNKGRYEEYKIPAYNEETAKLIGTTDYLKGGKQ